MHAGGSSSTVEVCLLRFWEARNVRRGGEFMGVDMLLLHSQAGGVGKTYIFQLSVTSFITLQSVRPSQSYASSTTSEAAATDLDQLQSTCSSYVIISSGFLSIPYCRFITVKAVFTNFAARRLYQNGFGLAEVVCMMSSAAYQAKKRCNNVQLAEETVAHRQAHALERLLVRTERDGGYFNADGNFVEYVRDKEVKVQIKHWFNV
ncbi:hypothetical protein HID58_093691 [Brassica napus]|uniref:Uncharacterized protein n=1 Tax=Brassica napus TaxID=3708 RepID=A0ABQ7X9Z8_BRANA|nr:hypothetical protein HID58_093691 [Brassica napus]